MSAMGGKRTLHGGRLKGYSDDMRVAIAWGVLGLLAVQAGCAAATGKSKPLEENYEFLSVTNGRCIPKIGVGIDPDSEAECQRMTEPRRYRGTWFVAFETSLFTPIGKQSCIETKGRTNCAELVGKALPWPSRWACPRQFEIEFVGRRNLLPGFDPTYRIVVDQLISAKRLPDPPHEPDECDPAAL